MNIQTSANGITQITPRCKGGGGEKGKGTSRGEGQRIGRRGRIIIFNLVMMMMMMMMTMTMIIILMLMMEMEGGKIARTSEEVGRDA